MDHNDVNATSLRHALAYLRAGFSVIPVRPDGTKIPAIDWKEFQKRRATEAEVRGWYDTDQSLGVGIVCGAVSGGLKVLDFDSEDTWKAYRKLLDLQAPELLKTIPAVRTPTGGMHLYLRGLPSVPGNRKLAQRPLPGNKRQTLIETRGEGGYVVAPGSPGSCHPSGKLYVWQTWPAGVAA